VLWNICKQILSGALSLVKYWKQAVGYLAFVRYSLVVYIGLRALLLDLLPTVLLL
jgi:hypothetical protein